MSKTAIAQLKVTLEEIRPPIWRRLLVPRDCTLEDLHYFLQIAMGWFDSHLHMFMKGQTIYEPDLPGMDALAEEGESHDEAKTRLKEVLPEVGSRIVYVYDFGDDWRHRVELEALHPREEGKQYPVCIKGRRACPPEDCGGPWGYQEIIEGLRAPDPDNVEQQELLEWLPDNFDPEALDLESINAELARWEKHKARVERFRPR